MYAAIRKYKTSSAEIFVGRVKDGFVPLISQEKGFMQYCLIETGKNEITTITMFDTKEGADTSNKVAAEWVLKNVSTLILNLDITQGEVMVHKPHLTKTK
jgi:hypothetical protein